MSPSRTIGYDQAATHQSSVVEAVLPYTGAGVSGTLMMFGTGAGTKKPASVGWVGSCRSTTRRPPPYQVVNTNRLVTVWLCIENVPSMVSPLAFLSPARAPSHWARSFSGN